MHFRRFTDIGHLSDGPVNTKPVKPGEALVAHQGLQDKGKRTMKAWTWEDSVKKGDKPSKGKEEDDG